MGGKMCKNANKICPVTIIIAKMHNISHLPHRKLVFGKSVTTFFSSVRKSKILHKNPTQ